MFTTAQSTPPQTRLSYDQFKKLSLEEQKRYKTIVLEELRDFHQPLIDELGISRNDFQMKMAFYDKQGRNVVGIFASEFKKQNGFYFELITREFEPVEESRSVYKISYNPAFEEEYEMNEKGSYLVPLEELRVFNPSSVMISGPSAILETGPKTTQQVQPRPAVAAYKAPAPIEDAPYGELTIRDYVAITTGKPVSAKNWLNELIRSLPNVK